jgi:hypothetical protein
MTAAEALDLLRSDIIFQEFLGGACLCLREPRPGVTGTLKGSALI